MKPRRAFKNLVPVKVFFCGGGNGRTGPVIDDLGRTLAGAFFQIVDAYTVAAPDDIRGIHAVFAEGIDSSLSDFMFRKFGNEFRVKAVIGQGNGHIGLAAAEGGAVFVHLYETVIAGRGQTQHNLSKGNNFLTHT